MNKTVNVNLGGMAYILDENAYDVLLNYLENLKKRFEASEQAEIMQDIESRIAELLGQKLNKSARTVVILADINEIIQKLGNPSDIAGEEENSNTNRNEPQMDFQAGRRLYRNTKDMIVGGVCSGLSMYLGINDPIWLRILFLAILFFSGGTIVIAYLIGMAIIPEAKTTMDLMQMKGTPINLSTFEKSFETLRNELNSANSRESVHKIVDIIIKICLYLLGAVLILAGMALFIAIGSLLFTVLFEQNFVGFSESTAIYDYLFTDNKMKFFIILGVLLAAGIPALSILFGGMELLVQKSLTPKRWGLISFFIWVIGVMMLVFVGYQIIRMMKSEGKIQTTIPIANPSNSTLKLLSIQDLDMEIETDGVYYNGVKMPKDSLYLPNIELSIQKSNTAEAYLLKESISAGKNAAQAKLLASQIVHNLSITDSSIFFDQLLKIQSPKPIYRNQKIRYTLFLPEGKSIYLDESIESIIYDIDNIQNLHDNDMLGHRFTMTQQGLSCTTCPESKLNNPESHHNSDKGKGKITINDNEYEIIVNKKEKRIV